jgi:hypothetical protein
MLNLMAWKFWIQCIRRSEAEANRRPRRDLSRNFRNIFASFFVSQRKTIA